LRQIAHEFDLKPTILAYQPDFPNQVADNLRGFDANFIPVQLLLKTRNFSL
jgi:hypothetical protein